MRNSAFLLFPASVLLAAPALAEDLPAQAASSEAEPPLATPVEPTMEATPVTASDAPSAPSPVPLTVPPPTPALNPSPAPPSGSESPLRPLLTQVAGQTRLRRYGESALGLTGAGVLFGVGFAAEAPDMTWSHALWVTSGIVALGSVANLFVPSELENLERNSSNLSEAELERRWQKLAQKARISRKVEAVFGGLLGIASVSLGVLCFEGELGTLTDDQQRIIGSVLVGGGALGITESVVQWFVPTPLETGFALATPRPQVSLAGAPSPNGFHLSLAGAF